MRDKRLSTVQALLVIAGVCLVFWNVTAGLIIGLCFLLPIVVAIDLGVSRQRTGWMWGFFLGWLGVLILAIMRPRPMPVTVVRQPDSF
jgi:hypothetical protein